VQPAPGRHWAHAPVLTNVVWPPKERMAGGKESAGEPCSMMHESQLVLTLVALCRRRVLLRRHQCCYHVVHLTLVERHGDLLLCVLLQWVRDGQRCKQAWRRQVLPHELSAAKGSGGDLRCRLRVLSQEAFSRAGRRYGAEKSFFR
jgi:hypothetical protein